LCGKRTEGACVSAKVTGGNVTLLSARRGEDALQVEFCDKIQPRPA
jgi:hypothetical protein